MPDEKPRPNQNIANPVALSFLLQWFRFDDGLVLPVSEAEVFSAEAYCLFYSRTNDTEKQWSTASKQES